jgi:transposase
MAHRNARLNVRGRALLVERVLGNGRPVAHVAKELGVSRQSDYRWISRFRREGEAGGGLHDRSARPHHSLTRTSPEHETRVLSLRREQRCGQDWIGAELGIPPRTVSAILRRHSAAIWQRATRSLVNRFVPLGRPHVGTNGVGLWSW